MEPCSRQNQRRQGKIEEEKGGRKEKKGRGKEVVEKNERVKKSLKKLGLCSKKNRARKQKVLSVRIELTTFRL